MELITISKTDSKNFCSSCGGWCCRIYNNGEYGTRNENKWWEEWVTNFHGDEETRLERYGVQPLYNASEAHIYPYFSDIDYHRALYERGIDTDYCEYRGPNGCIIPEHNRPVGCKNYFCTKFSRYLFSYDDIASLVKNAFHCKTSAGILKALYVEDGNIYCDSSNVTAITGGYHNNYFVHRIFPHYAHLNRLLLDHLPAEKVTEKEDVDVSF